jgi:hypothetical protein
MATGRHPFVFFTFFYTARHGLVAPMAGHTLILRTLVQSPGNLVVQIHSIFIRSGEGLWEMWLNKLNLLIRHMACGEDSSISSTTGDNKCYRRDHGRVT